MKNKKNEKKLKWLSDKPLIFFKTKNLNTNKKRDKRKEIIHLILKSKSSESTLHHKKTLVSGGNEDKNKEKKNKLHLTKNPTKVREKQTFKNIAPLPSRSVEQTTNTLLNIKEKRKKKQPLEKRLHFNVALN